MAKLIAFSSTYQNLCTEYYDLDKPSAPEDALAYYLEHAKEAKGPILEPMCGTGSFLIPLSKKGFDITGFDNSRHMLDACRRKCQDNDPRSKLFEASFRSFAPEGKYGLVFIPSSSFCLLTDSEEASYALSRVHEWLEDDGKFVFEIETRNAARTSQNIWKANWVRKQDGSLIVLNHVGQFDPGTSIETVLCRYEHWKNNTIALTEVEEFCLKLYTPSAIERLLSQCGFHVQRRIQPYVDTSPDEKAEIIVYECIKSNR